MVIEAAVMCLALNIYHEARGEVERGQIAVALVTMNRAKNSKRVCYEVFRPHQFSWTTGKVKKVKRGYKLSKSALPRESLAWLKAKAIAARVISGLEYDFTHGAQFFHTTEVKPYWMKAFTRVAKIGNHIFYRQDRSPPTILALNEEKRTNGHESLRNYLGHP